MSTRYLLDANILLRFLSGEPVRQAEAAKKLFAQAAAGEVLLDVSPVIVAETIYTLLPFMASNARRRRQTPHALAPARLENTGWRPGVFRPGTPARCQCGVCGCLSCRRRGRRNVSIASFDRDLDKFQDVNTLRADRVNTPLPVSKIMSTVRTVAPRLF